LYEFSGAVKVKNWIFVLERIAPGGPITIPEANKNMWMLAGYFRDMHCSFTPLEPDPNLQLNVILVNHVIQKFLPILCPECLILDTLQDEKKIECKWGIKLYPINHEEIKK
jgi:hypothetical protein